MKTVYRNTFLAAAGILVLAGCGSSSGDSGTTCSEVVRPSIVKIDKDGDGTVDEIQTNTYNERGKMEEYTVETADGTPLSKTFFEHNEAGDLVELVRTENGTVVNRTTFVYNDRHQQVHAETDSDGDGRLDRITTYTYTPDGRTATAFVDIDADGQVDLKEVREKNDEGLLAVYKMDIGNDGTFEQITTYTYDTGNRLVKVSFDRDSDGIGDNDADGKEDYAITYAYVLDAQGQVLREEEDDGNDGTVDTVYTYTYDDDGFMTSMATDSDGDGKADRIAYYTKTVLNVCEESTP